MNRTFKFIGVLTLFSALLSSCNDELADFFGSSQEEGTFPNVDKALWPHFEKFEQEADLRGLKIDLADAVITGYISDISTNHVLGQCSYSNIDPYKVTIDKPFWDNASELAREFVVFHELGHCYLGRLHDESTGFRGVCESIMRSGTGACKDNYNISTRSKYLDELFTDLDN